MATWVVDLVLDLEWFQANGGTAPTAAGRSTGKDHRGQSLEFLVYGDSDAIRHLRILIQADGYEEASQTVDTNVAFWREAISVTSAMASPHYAAAATLGSQSTLHPVAMAEGNAETPFLTMTLQRDIPQPADHNVAAALMAVWPRELRHHLHFLAKFLNPNLPADIRWHQGYRFLEWHFERGGAKLAKNKEFREFLLEHGSGLDRVLPAGRTRAGFLEEIRAIVAHALLADRPTEAAQQQVQNAVMETFAVLEHMVLVVLNRIAPSGLEFVPKTAMDVGDL